ncbi:MAG: hypothetical protein WDW36_008250 [Sanguina aurantia]
MAMGSSAVSVFLLALCAAAIMRTSATDINALFTKRATLPDMCNIGPSYWPSASPPLPLFSTRWEASPSILKTPTLVLPPPDHPQAQCMVSPAFDSIKMGGNPAVISPEGYGSKPTIEENIYTFCTTNPQALSWNGGIAGAPTGMYGYVATALYWAPSSCKFNDTCCGFCSPYTQNGSYAETHMVMHGMWPDYGSIYSNNAPPLGPLYNGSYTPWPQWCKGPEGDFYSLCNVNGAKSSCPLPAAQFSNFTQGAHEACIRQFNVTACQVGPDTIAALAPQFALYAPGYLGSNFTFLDHEFFKHGSCFGGQLSANKTFFFQTALAKFHEVTGPGSVVAQYINANAGGSVNATLLAAAFRGTAIPRCSAACNLQEVWLCSGREVNGMPSKGLVTCPVGTLASNSCGKCPTIYLPTYSSPPHP